MEVQIIKRPGQRVRYGCPYCGQKFNWMHKADEHMPQCEYFTRRISKDKAEVEG